MCTIETCRDFSSIGLTISTTAASVAERRFKTKAFFDLDDRSDDYVIIELCRFSVVLYNVT